MLKGIDVSSYQSSSYSTTCLSFVGIKVTEGLFTYVALGPDRQPRPVPPENSIVAEPFQ